MKTDIPTNGSMVKNHISLKTGFGYLQYGELRSYCGSRLIQGHLRRQESHSSSSSSASSSSPTVSEIQIREREDAPNSDTSPVQVSNAVGGRSGRPDDTQANKTPKTNKKETTIERETR